MRIENSDWTLESIRGHARESTLSALAHSVLEALSDAPVAAFGVYERDREWAVVWGPTAAPWTGPLSPPEVAAFASQRTYRVESSPSALERRILGADCSWGASLGIPLPVDGAAILIVGSSEQPAESTIGALERYASALAPIIESRLNAVRFEHGDKRRASLVGLSDALHRTQRPAAVVASACGALRGLDAHVWSCIELLPEGKEPTVDCHEPGETADGDPIHSVRPLRGSLVEEVLRTGRTHESGDLAVAAEWPEERMARDRGARRAIASPLVVRERIIGAMVIAVREASRFRRVDRWLAENIALQVALALDNARQFTRIRALSEELAQQNRYLREEIRDTVAEQGMVGASTAINGVRQAISKVACTDATVLITGETGVGKELVARAIHEASSRASQPMVKVNCAALAEGMFESELFGHERGAFTSAVDRRIGRFELAKRGTIFLDEIGELSPAVQAKLLRVLQEGEFERVGGSTTLKTDARVIAATNRCLATLAESGAFRPDLYFRLNVFPISVPALRERGADIAALAEHFVAQFNRTMGRRVERIDPDSLFELAARRWPGNVRELRHVIERAMILADGPILVLPSEAGGPQKAIPAAPGRDKASQPIRLADAQAEHIRWALEQTGGVIEGEGGAARLLGLAPSTLRFRMKRLGVER